MSAYKFFQKQLDEGKITGEIKVVKCTDPHHKFNGQDVLQLTQMHGTKRKHTICFHGNSISEQLQEIEIFKRHQNGKNS